jgi:hypothetical protein
VYPVLYRTLKQRGLDPLADNEVALRHHTTGILLPLPDKMTSAGRKVAM